MKTKFTIWCLLLSCMVTAQDKFTLESAKTYALAHSQEITNSKLDQKLMESKVWETKAIGLPQVSAKGAFSNFIDIPTTVLPAKAFNPMAPEGELIGLQFGTNYSASAELNVSQLIFSGNYLVGLQAIKATSQLTMQLTEKKEKEVKANVAEAFYTVLILHKNKGILDSTLIKMKELHQLTKQLIAEEVMPRTNGAQLELGVLQIQNTIKTLESQTQMAKNFLKFQMGYPLDNKISLSGDLSETTIDIATVTPENNIDFKLLNAQLTIKELSLKNTKANYLPSLAGYFSYQKQALRNDFDFLDANKEWYPTTLWGLQLNIPIFSSGQRMAQVNQAKIEVEKTNNSILQLTEGLKLQILQANTHLEMAQNKIILQKKAQEIAQSVLDDNEILYKEGTITSIELTQAQNQLLTEQTNYTNALFELIKAKLELEKLAQ